MIKQRKKYYSPAAARGIALIVALLLLVMLTILGVTSMSSVVMQERMAGNVNLQSLAFEAASAGVPESLDFADPANWGVDAAGNPRICTRGGGEWLANWTAFTEIDVEGLPAGISVGYRQRLGCFEPVNPPVEWDDFVNVSLQVLVLNRGEVRRGNEVLAQREVEVRVDRRGEADCMLTLGPLDFIGMGNSKKGVVDGGPAGCPIRTANQADAQEMINQLVGNGGNSLLGNYMPNPPGIHAGPMRGVWGDPESLARVANAIKIGIRAWNAWDTHVGVVDCDSLPPGLDCDDLPPGWAIPPNPFASCQGNLYLNNPSPPPNGGLNYIANNLTVGGSGEVRGLVFIEGELEFNGNATYNGDLLILGGRLWVNGFGNAGNTGSLQLHNLVNRDTTVPQTVAYDPDDASFALNQAFNINGMGNASITPDNCVIMRGRYQQVNDCLAELKEKVDDDSFFVYRDTLHASWPPQPDLDIPDFGDDPDLVEIPLPRCGQFVNPREVIASWREYIDRERWN